MERDEDTENTEPPSKKIKLNNNDEKDENNNNNDENEIPEGDLKYKKKHLCFKNSNDSKTMVFLETFKKQKSCLLSLKVANYVISRYFSSASRDFQKLPKNFSNNRYKSLNASL